MRVYKSLFNTPLSKITNLATSYPTHLCPFLSFLYIKEHPIAVIQIKIEASKFPLIHHLHRWHLNIKLEKRMSSSLFPHQQRVTTSQEQQHRCQKDKHSSVYVRQPNTKALSVVVYIAVLLLHQRRWNNIRHTIVVMIKINKSFQILHHHDIIIYDIQLLLWVVRLYICNFINLFFWQRNFINLVCSS